jgi:hypothetical protein
MRSETALRAAADMRRVRLPACLIDRRSARRRFGNASSGNVRSIAMLRDAYGKNYERLVALKKRYDPGNLFRMNLNIPPAATVSSV